MKPPRQHFSAMAWPKESKNQQKGWEDNFRENFASGSFGLTNKQYKEISSFISSLLEEVVREIVPPKQSQFLKNDLYGAGYYNCREAILRIAKEKYGINI